MRKTKKNLEKIVSSLQWNVFYEDINSKEIKIYNVFRHGGFYNGVIESLLKCSTKEEFSEEVLRQAMWYYWSKCEWEVVLTSWPPYIDQKELGRLNQENEEGNRKYGHYPYKLNIIPIVGKKIDVYDQLKLNWDIFINYIWNSVERGLKNDKLS